MIHLCAVCNIKIGPDTNGSGVSHGLCRFHELISLEQAGLLSTEEISELSALRIKGA